MKARFLLAAVPALLALTGPQPLPAGQSQASQPATSSGKSQYTGPGSCSSSSCHGSVQPLAATRVLQNEYSTWVVKDRHARAFEVLSQPVSQRMAKILGLGSADSAPKCLACHALDVPAEQRARTFSLRDGVSCESCHGPASAWLGPHTTRGWTHGQSVAAGMFDTKDLVPRAEKCLSCHLGTAEKSVDHEMLAAGHPDLYFELDAFTAVMPAHWKEPFDQDPWLGARAWGVGQAVQLREALRQLERRARAGTWPEFAEMQCFACHHNLTKPDQSWRLERGYPSGRPGNPPWNASRYVVFRALAQVVDPAAAQQIDASLSQIAQGVGRLDADRAALSALAGRAALSADALARRVAGLGFDHELVLRLQKQICSDAPHISAQGERAAEQAAMALDSLFVAYARSAKPANEAAVREAIQGLFRQVQDPAAYRPQSFTSQMNQVHSLLNSLR